MKIVKGKVVTCTEYYREFMNDGSGFSFPCGEDGVVILDNEDARANYEWCKAHADRFETVELTKRQYSYRENDIGICDVCHRKVDVHDEYYGAFECEYCGQWYNLFGQRLLPPDQWEDDYE